MKQLLPFTFLFFFAFSSQAQMCNPDLTIPDSIFVSPSPYDSTDMTGGIADTACTDIYYETVFTFRVPDMVEVSGFPVRIDSIVLPPNEPNSVQGLPVGMQFNCNPPNCVFSPTKDSIGCALVYGTATDVNTPGDYPLTINAKLYSSLGSALDLPFPNSLIPGADGQYILNLQGPGFANCTTISTDEAFQADFSLRANPNPFAYYTNIEIESRVNGALQLAVFNVLGDIVHQQNIQLFEGTNNIEFDGSLLATGLYVYALTDGKNVITRKFMIQR